MQCLDTCKVAINKCLKPLLCSRFCQRKWRVYIYDVSRCLRSLEPEQYSQGYFRYGSYHTFERVFKWSNIKFWHFDWMFDRVVRYNNVYPTM